MKSFTNFILYYFLLFVPFIPSSHTLIGSQGVMGIRVAKGIYYSS